MPRHKKPSAEMTDRELFESLFPKPIRERVKKEIELDTDSEAAETIEEFLKNRSTESEDK